MSELPSPEHAEPLSNFNIDQQLHMLANPREALPAVPLSFLQPGDVLRLDCLSTAQKSCLTKFRVEEVGDTDEAGFTPVKVKVLWDTSNSPLKFWRSYWLGPNSATSFGTWISPGDIQKHGYQWLVQEGHSVHQAIRTSCIRDVTIKRDGEVIKPFER